MRSHRRVVADATGPLQVQPAQADARERRWQRILVHGLHDRRSDPAGPIACLTDHLLRPSNGCLPNRLPGVVGGLVDRLLGVFFGLPIKTAGFSFSWSASMVADISTRVSSISTLI